MRRVASLPDEIPPDPFGERERVALHQRHQLLGGQFHFETDSPQLLRIVDQAYARLPSHRFARPGPRLDVKLLLTRAMSPRTRRERAAGHKRAAAASHIEPPQVRPLSGGGLLCGAMESANFMAVTPQQRSAVVVVSPDMLQFSYHIRYELLEFAVYMLAARVQRLIPLHAACVGLGGTGILLLGESGAGKTTLALHCLRKRLDFLAEDSVLVEPKGLLATGLANYLHIRRDSLRFLPGAERASLLRGATVIRRRSGVEKLEIDLRRAQFRLAPSPLRIVAAARVSPAGAGGGPLLVPVKGRELLIHLASTQPYAASHAGWRGFARAVERLPTFELRRGRHPAEAAAALQELLQGMRSRGDGASRGAD